MLSAALSDRTLVSWMTVYIFYTLAVFITILYWSMLYDSSSPPSYTNLFVHGLQATSQVK